MQNGAPMSLFATATYPSWSDIGITVDSSGLPHLTNLQCQLFQSLMPSSLLKTRLSIEMARVLPIPSTSIVFPSSNLTCGPYNPLATQDDQRAAFTVSGLTMTALYTLFAQGATYVTYNNPSVDHSQQVSEILAPLSISAVRNAFQSSLRRIFLNVYYDYLG